MSHDKREREKKHQTAHCFLKEKESESVFFCDPEYSRRRHIFENRNKLENYTVTCLPR